MFTILLNNGVKFLTIAVYLFHNILVFTNYLEGSYFPTSICNILPIYRYYWKYSQPVLPVYPNIYSKLNQFLVILGTTGSANTKYLQCVTVLPVTGTDFLHILVILVDPYW